MHVRTMTRIYDWTTNAVTNYCDRISTLKATASKNSQKTVEEDSESCETHQFFGFQLSVLVVVDKSHNLSFELFVLCLVYIFTKSNFSQVSAKTSSSVK